MHPQRHEPLEDPVPGLIQCPLTRQRDEVLEAEGRLQRFREVREQIERRRLGTNSRLGRHPPAIRIATTAHPMRPRRAYRASRSTTTVPAGPASTSATRNRANRPLARPSVVCSALCTRGSPRRRATAPSAPATRAALPWLGA